MLATDKADDPLARAEQALVGALERVRRMDAARNASGSTPRAIEVKTDGFNKATREALFHAAHDIKGEAATFGFPACRRCRRQPLPADRAHARRSPHPARAGRSACRRHPRHHARERRSRLHSHRRGVDTDFTGRHRRISRQREPRPPRCARGNSSPFPRPGAVFLIQHYVAATRRHRSLFSLSATRDRGVTRPRLSSLAVCN